MSLNETEFVVFCIEELAIEYNKSGRDIYQILSINTNMIEEYIIPNYEVLHSMGRDAIIQELKDLLKERGVV